MATQGEIWNNVYDSATQSLKTNTSTSSTSSTATVTSVDDTNTSTTLITANSSAKERMIQNDSSATLYVRFGAAAASATDYTFKLVQDDILVTQYKGEIRGIWSANSTGAAKITELT